MLVSTTSPHLADAPLIISPRRPGESIEAAAAASSDEVRRGMLAGYGVLFRGFDVAADGLRAFAASFGEPLISYDFASTPRTAVGDMIYTSTEYPASQSIPFHNEQSYTREWPMRIWFHCVTPAGRGGQTPIVDSRKVFAALDADVRRLFAEKDVLYVRNYGNGLDLPWQKVFATEKKSDVEAYCRKKGVAFEWTEDGDLRTKQIAQGCARHPTTAEDVWFNQAHLFHHSALPPEIREALLDAVDEDDLPRNAYFGDGSRIDEDVLEHVRSVMAAHSVSFDWQPNDVLMLDNMLTAHGRAPFAGARKVLVAMAMPHVATSNH